MKPEANNITYFNNEYNQKIRHINMVLGIIKNNTKYSIEFCEATSFLLCNNKIYLTCLFPYIEYFPSITQNDKDFIFVSITEFQDKPNMIESQSL